MRANVKEIKKNGYEFVLEYDTGGDGAEYTCWVYKNGKEVFDNNGYQVRKCFGEKFNYNHYRNFANKFATDEQYRKTFM